MELFNSVLYKNRKLDYTICVLWSFLLHHISLQVFAPKYQSIVHTTKLFVI